MSYQHILFDVSENIGVITLNRPDDANAIHKPMVEELLDIASGFEAQSIGRQ